MRRVLVVALTVSLAGGPAVTASPAVPGHRRIITVVGRGWGHGIGMGQWGARGMADEGTSWRRIVHHYYSHVRIARRDKGERIRVLLQTSRRVIVSSRRAFDILTSSGMRTARGGRFYRVRRRHGTYVIHSAGSPSGPWHRFARSRGAVVFRPRSTMLRLVRPSGAVRWYRGSIRVRGSRRRLRAILRLPLEEYLLGVVPREMPAVWPMAALKAQAVTARTYAARVRDHARAHDRAWDICATARCQVFGGTAIRRRPGERILALEHARTSGAVRATRRRVIVSRGRPILAQYSSSTGGWTAPGASRALRPVRDRADRIAPFHAWKQTVRVSRIEARWPSIGRLRRIRITARNGYGRWGGRVLGMRLVGTRGSVRISGDDLRRALGLPSNWFRVRGPREKRYRFRFDMGYGTWNRAVSRLQRRLRAEGFYPKRAPITTYFGPITRASVRRYQRAHRIRPTGYLGPITRGRLNRT